MQSTITLTGIGGFLKKSLMILSLFCFVTGSINAQVYVNGNLSTGATSSDGTAAPAGFTWSEVQPDNNTSGVGANITAGFTVADDFTIPAGSWSLTKFTCYAYSTNYAGATSPFNDVRVKIYSGNPSIGAPAVVFGDLTTNRLAASSTANMYRIFNGTPGTTRQIWKIEANVAVTLAAGTYWIEWQVGTAQASNFSPTSTVVGTSTQPGNNALQNTLPATWLPILDGPNADEPQDMPFRLDYTTSACAGTPAPGNTLTTATAVCPAIPFTLSPENGTGGSGVTYQWQSSDDGVTFTDIAGATNGTYTTTLTSSTFYQVVVICSGGTPGISTPVQVTLNPANACYCIPATTDCTDGDIITRVQLNSLDNTSDCGPNGFTNYSIDPTITIPDVVQGIGNAMSVTAGGGIFDEYVAVWIDADHSGTFDASEFSDFGTTTGGTLTANLNVPATAILGPARMRVRVRFNTPLLPGSACLAYTYGETEDYTVNIVPCVQGVINTQPVATAASCGDGVTLTIGATGTNLTYQWQVKTSATAPWVNVTDDANTSGSTTDTLTISTVDASFDQYQYRVVLGGGCTAVDFSSVAVLTVNPLVVMVSPASFSSCTAIDPAAPVQLSITNVSGGSTVTSTDYASGTINLAIPDLDDAVGVTSMVTVPALPAGAVITGAKVTFNATHTYAGDLIMVLKAPNGRVLNLDYALTSTGGPGVTTGFTNTVISSTGTATLVSGTDPWTGTFAPDAVTTPAAGNPPSSPSVVAPNADATSFSDLYSVPQGDWILGVYDYASPDEGVLTDWTLTLTYSVTTSTPFTGVWSPAAGLFTDAAGTTPYVDGTEANTVYAAPTTSTVYTVVVNNALCPTDPVEVPVNLLRPDPTVTITTAPYTMLQPGLFTTATAIVTPAPGSGASYQWFANGTPISGATSSTFQAGVDAIGTLSVEVTDPTTCSGKASASTLLTDSASTTLFIYPNPTNGMFQVRFNGGVNDLQARPRILTIYDSKGSRVYSKTYQVSNIYSRMDVDLSQQPKGVYIIDLTDISGNRLQSERVIVQ